MTTPGTRDAARARRRYFALVAAGGLASVLVIGVAMRPDRPARPSAHGAASPTAAPLATAAGSLSADTAAKLAAEDAGTANPAANAAAPQVAASQASWNAPPRIVRYHGYQVRVPGSWPVYDLAANPAQCVLFNTHAVYLGTPGSAQDCPAHAVGRTEALLIQPASPDGAPPSAVVLRGSSAALPKHASLPAAAAGVAAASHVIQVEVPRPGVLVTATYGASQARIRAILASTTMTGARPASRPAASQSSPSAAASHSSPSAAAAPGAPAPATQAVMATGSKVASGELASGEPASGKAASGKAASGKAASGKAASGKAASGKAAAVPAPQLTGMTGSGLGFDTCTAPSVSTMTSWLASPYRVVGTYLGGVNWACSYGNFTPSWVRRVAAEGWRFMPLWVGRQAPCTSVRRLARIDPARAAAEGRTEAVAAVSAARAFGYSRGTPIYFDMEGYNSTIRTCTRAVLNFLGGWTSALHAAGYVSGAYSSASSGIRDLASQYNKSTYPSPDDIWIADWNSEPVLTDPNLPNAYWPHHQRLHQYSGPHKEKWGGGTLDIDTDAADGLVVGLRTAPVLRGPDESAVPSELAVAPGKTATVQLTLRGVAGTPVFVHWRVAAPAHLAVTPSHGRVDLWPRAVYSVTLTLAPAASLATGRYDVPITVAAGSQAVAKTFVLVSVARAGTTLSTAYPIVLYAADRASMAVAARIARALALPPGDVTGSFRRAWADVAGGRALVLAVGKPAANALYFNVCGWANPAGEGAGHTPFYYSGEPLRRPPGRNYFELADMNTAAGTALLTTQLTQYALAGTLPDYGSRPATPVAPTLTCMGSPNVKVP